MVSLLHCLLYVLRRRAEDNNANKEIIRTLQVEGKTILSVYEENHVAISQYQSFEFQFTRELDTKGEKIMVIKGFSATT